MFPRDLKHRAYFFSERTRGRFQYGERHLEQFLGGCKARGNHECVHRRQVNRGNVSGVSIPFRGLEIVPSGQVLNIAAYSMSLQSSSALVHLIASRRSSESGKCFDA